MVCNIITKYTYLSCLNRSNQALAKKINMKRIFFQIQVNDARRLSTFILALQWERAAVSLSVFLDAKTGQTTDISVQYANTDRALRMVADKWRPYGPEKVFENPLRFQIRIDDFRLQKRIHQLI